MRLCRRLDPFSLTACECSGKRCSFIAKRSARATSRCSAATPRDRCLAAVLTSLLMGSVGCSELQTRLESTKDNEMAAFTCVRLRVRHCSQPLADASFVQGLPFETSEAAIVQFFQGENSFALRRSDSYLLRRERVSEARLPQGCFRVPLCLFPDAHTRASRRATAKRTRSLRRPARRSRR